MTVIPAEERFWAKVDRSGDCWLWTGAVDGRGRGTFYLTRRKRQMANRFAYELLVAPIPPGRELRRRDSCPISCVSPSHYDLAMPLEERFWAKVFKTNSCWLWTSSINTSRGYGTFQVEGKTLYAHRVAYELLLGNIPVGSQVDHLPTCPKICVNPGHLRLVTNKQNQENLSGARSNSKSGVRGVFWVPQVQKYRAQVRHNRKLINVGYYSTIEEAEAAVIAKRNELFTHNDLDRT